MVARGARSARSTWQAASPTLYRAVIPGEEVVEGLRYWIEALDAEGRQAAYPASGRPIPSP